jgi:5-methyltetrahydropteroyltriglutamate--homocysteine methyltransferase
MDGKPVDEARLKARVKDAVAEIVKKQVEAGVDVVSDGEMSKVGFSNYVTQRYSGFGKLSQFMAVDMADVPDVVTRAFGSEGGQHIYMPFLEGPMEIKDPSAVETDIANFKAALNGRGVDDAFIPAVTPGQVAFNFPNKYYNSMEAYLEAAANALRFEYNAIVKAGFNLQLDSPDLVMTAHCFSEGNELYDPRKRVPLAIEALNLATRDIPPEKMRLHLCWGNYAGPHTHDIELQEIVEPVMKTRAAFVYVEAANPRHEHEWEVWEKFKLPAGKALIPGVIDTLTNIVEHPRLVAQRIERFANIVGRENVVAGTDCGFGTFVGYSAVDPKVAWLKLKALSEGAKIASERLW